jgi:hypothetical protein
MTISPGLNIASPATPRPLLQGATRGPCQPPSALALRLGFRHRPGDIVALKLLLKFCAA